MLESSIQSNIKKKLRKAGWHVEKVSNLPGWPDLILVRGVKDCRFAEIKRPGKKPDPLQEYIHNLLKKFGFTVYVWESATDIPNEILKSR